MAKAKAKGKSGGGGGGPKEMLLVASKVRQMIKDAGCKIICQVQTLAQAKEAAQAGADVIIAQGRDAGGHSGTTRGTIGLVGTAGLRRPPAAVGREQPRTARRQNDLQSLQRGVGHPR